MRFTDEAKYFVSEASVYRLLKAHDLITSPAYIVIKAAEEFNDKTTAPKRFQWVMNFDAFQAKTKWRPVDHANAGPTLPWAAIEDAIQLHCVELARIIFEVMFGRNLHWKEWAAPRSVAPAEVPTRTRAFNSSKTDTACRPSSAVRVRR